MTKERSVALFGFRHLAHAPHSSNCQDDFAAAHIQQHDAQFALMLVIADALVGDHLASSTVRSFSLHEGSRDAFLTESMPRRSKITMDHVARAAGVSKQTISAVINNKSGISEKTRVRVRQIIARLDYQPNMLAGSLRAQRSFTVGVVVPSINNPFYPELVRGIEDEAQRYSYSVFLCNSDENPEKELNYLHLLRRHRIAGLIAVTIKASGLWTEALEKLATSGVPVVELLTSRTSGRVDIISIDDEEGFVKATAHLLDLGHDRIGLIMPPENPNEEQNPRVRGFLKAHALRGRKVASELLAPGGWHVANGQNAAAYLMGLPRPPTAIAAANDMAAIGAITTLKELKRRVPEDVAVVGYDNIAIAEWYDPSLTTVDQPRYQMGKRAMQALLKRIENPNDPAEMVKLETSLIVRRSSGGLKVRMPPLDKC